MSGSLTVLQSGSLHPQSTIIKYMAAHPHLTHKLDDNIQPARERRARR